VVDYRHVIHSLRAKPGALPGLVYRDQLFPRDAYRRLYDAAMAALPAKAACRLVVDALALAHDRACEADLAALIDASLDEGVLPDRETMHARFAPDPGTLPSVTVSLTPLSLYDALTASTPSEFAEGEAA
jgi:hypothetical protein